MTTHKILNPRTITLTVVGILLLAAAIISGIALLNQPINESDDSLATAVPGSEPPYNFDYSWTDGHPYVAHAFGGVLGNAYTNSYEAFLLNYQLGHRVFEVDFFITDDGRTVAAHDGEHWQSNATVRLNSDIYPEKTDTTSFTYDNFVSSLWYDKYHTVTLDDLFKIMQEYPDIHIVTDTKYADESSVRLQFNEFLTAARAIDESLLDRFIIQIYRPEMLAWIMDVYPWKSVIYTLYSDPNWTPENVLAFSEESGVKFITMWGSWVTQEIMDLWKPQGMLVATHTINQLTTVDRLQKLGVDIFYTDFLLP